VRAREGGAEGARERGAEKREATKSGARATHLLVRDKRGALEGARRSHDEACKKFFTGQGNAMRQAEMLKELGVKPSKALSPKWTSTLDEPPAALPDA
jgi:hypothetical protein